MHDFDIICLSETYLTSTKDTNDENLKIPGYIMNCVDRSSDVKRGGVCIYYKTMLSLKVLSTNFLQKYINFEVSIGNKKNADLFIFIELLINLRMNFMTF